MHRRHHARARILREILADLSHEKSSSTPQAEAVAQTPSDVEPVPKRRWWRLDTLLHRNRPTLKQWQSSGANNGPGPPARR